MKAILRLQHICRHIQIASCSYSTPALHITPHTSLVDEKVDIGISGLQPHQSVTVVAKTTENRQTFQSQWVVKADEHGNINNYTSTSLDGTFTGVEPMGLFWSMLPNSGVRLIKKDVSEPLIYSIHVYPGSHPDTDTYSTDAEPILAGSVNRLFKHPGVKRIPVTHETFRGTIFVPEGEGPFPALIDMFGGLVSLIETRAALLASHGYATFALSYLYGDGLPKTLLSADLQYIQGATEWFSQQSYVDIDRLGALGLCFGGTLCLYLASILPQIKLVVNVNGVGIHEGHLFDQNLYGEDKWPRPSRVYRTSEGVIINDVFQTDHPVCIPAWQYGAKVLQISGLDDKQVHPKWHVYYADHWPEELRSHFEFEKYPGAGHLIEPPYTPLCRAVNAGPDRLSTIDFLPPQFYDEALMAGGYPRQHAHAQEDSWCRILNFLHKHFKHNQT